MSSNFIINATPAAPDAAIVSALTAIPVSHISDNLRRLEGVVGLQPFHAGRKLVGTAVTVKLRAGDNLLTYKALSMMRPGQVLVVDAGGVVSNAIVGELLMLYAVERGCAGFVVDGAIRDSKAFHDADFPCYARDRNHRGPFKTGPGSINVAVSIGGQVVQPGDYIVGDEDGIVVFPANEATDLIEAAETTAAAEEAIRQEILTGAVRQSWMAKMFSSHGISLPD